MNFPPPSNAFGLGSFGVNDSRKAKAENLPSKIPGISNLLNRGGGAVL